MLDFVKRDQPREEPTNNMVLNPGSGVRGQLSLYISICKMKWTKRRASTKQEVFLPLLNNTKIALVLTTQFVYPTVKTFCKHHTFQKNSNFFSPKKKFSLRVTMLYICIFSNSFIQRHLVASFCSQFDQSHPGCISASRGLSMKVKKGNDQNLTPKMMGW